MSRKFSYGFKILVKLGSPMSKTKNTLDTLFFNFYSKSSPSASRKGQTYLSEFHSKSSLYPYGERYKRTVKPLRPPFGAQRRSTNCLDGWMDGWMRCDILPPSIFLIFKYDNTQHVLIPKMCLKVAYAF